MTIGMQVGWCAAQQHARTQLNLGTAEPRDHLPHIFAQKKQCMTGHIIPTKRGQICKLIDPLPDDNPNERFLILEDLDQYADNTMIFVVSLIDLQKHIANPSAAPLKSVMKKDLTVIAQDFDQYFAAGN